jgi:hypothetical protein
MKRITQSVRHGHVWNNYVVQRTVLTIGSFVALVLASGAGSHWY